MTSAASITVVSESGRRTRKPYKCFSCGKVFRRNEHCIRHERAHTQERPYSCRFCEKSYARKDLVKRHERTLHVNEYQALQLSTTRADNAQLEEPAVSSDTSDTPSIYEDGHGEPRENVARLKDSETPSGTQLSSYQARADFENLAHAVADDASHRAFQLDAMRRRSDLDPSTGYEEPNLTSDYSRQEAPLSSLLHHDDGQYRSPGSRLGHEVNYLGPPPGLTAVNTSSNAMQGINHTFMDFFTADSTFPMLNLSYTSPISHSCSSCPENGIDSALHSSQAQGAALSPPTSTEREHSRKLFSHLPRILKEKSDDFPKVELDEAAHLQICRDLCCQLGPEVCRDSMPSFKTLRRCFLGYIDCAQRHLPIIHLPSLNPSESPSALILVMSSVGALYRLDRRRACSTYNLARKLLDKFDVCNDGNVTTVAPVWTIQTRLLLTLFAFFTGDASLATAEFRNLGRYLLDYRLRRQSIMRQAELTTQESWQDYISRESQKRALCGIHIMSNLVSVTYDVCPGLENPEDFDFEMPDEEKIWNARSADEWWQLLSTRVTEGHRTLKDVFVDIVGGNQKEVPEQEKAYGLTAFGALVVAHAVCIHMWACLRFTQAFGTISPMGSTSLRSTIIAAANATLARCHKSLTRDDDEEGNPECPSWDDPDGPLIFNNQAILRIAHTRLFMPISPFRRIVLISGTEEAIDEAAESYVATPLERSPLHTKAASQACQGFLTPVQVGHLLVRKTATFSWSGEHMVAGWDSALFLTKWVHTVETEAATRPASEDEQRMLAQIKDLLFEMEQCQHMNPGVSLAAALSQAWSTFFTDVWVWGITPKMGFVLERLALSYQRSFDRFSAEGGQNMHR